MTPSRELDALVAEKVMGLKIKKGFYVEPHINKKGENREWIKKYSSDLNAAFEVLRFLHLQGIAFCIEQAPSAKIPTVHIVPKENYRQDCAVKFIEDMEKISNKSESVAHAICLASLMAVGVEV